MIRRLYIKEYYRYLQKNPKERRDVKEKNYFDDKKKQAILQKHLSYKNIRKVESSLSERKRKNIEKERIYVKISLQIMFGILKRRQYPETSND